MMGTIPVAFANPLPSLHPLDFLVGLCCGAGLRLAVYLRGKNAKKYRHGCLLYTSPASPTTIFSTSLACAYPSAETLSPSSRRSRKPMRRRIASAQKDQCF